MRLKELLKGLSNIEIEGESDRSISGIAYDSRAVEPGYLFVAMIGEVTDGNNYIASAIDNGAVAILSENERGSYNVPVWIKSLDARSDLATITGNWFDFPDRELVMVGITGTNGKTTVAHIMRTVCEEIIGPTGMIGTIKYVTPSRQEKALLTTPESLESRALFKEMLQAGCKAAIMEASSVAIHRHRVRGFHYDAVVFTNLSRDHLDYHGDMEEYYLAKRELFMKKDLIKPVAVINIDDQYGSRLAKETDLRTVTFGKTEKADIRIVDIKLSVYSTRMTIKYQSEVYNLESPLLGRFNAENMMAAFATSIALGFHADDVVKAIKNVQPALGRIDPVPGDYPFRIMIDFAHTDDALLKLLEAANELTEGRIIVAFGCGGDKDTGKRPLMGKHAVRLSDIAILTSDNPRTEDPLDIIADVRKGIAEEANPRAQLVIEPDRRKAIFKAIELAQPGDLVLLAGKGHEDYQVLGTKRIHFDDREVAMEALKQR